MNEPTPEEPSKDEKKKPPKEKPNRHSLTRFWSKVDVGVMLLPANVSQAHKKFKGHNQQSAATAVVASSFAHLQPTNSWTPETLDAILSAGDHLHLKSRQEDTNRCREALRPVHISKYFYLGNLKVTTKIEDLTKVVLFKDGKIVPNFENRLHDFLGRHVSGIFCFHGRYFTFWKYYKYYFLFDSTEHDRKGEKWTGALGLGCATLSRFTKLRKLVETVFKFIERALKHKNRFLLYPVRVENSSVVDTKAPQTLEEAVLPPKSVKPRKSTVKVKKPAPPKLEVTRGDEGEKHVKAEEKILEVSVSVVPPRKPKLESVTNFRELTTGTSGILRASTHQTDPNFTKYQGAQSFSNALAALTMLRLHKSKHWHRTILNDVLRTGEKLHHDTLKLPPDELPNAVTIDERTFHPQIKKYHGGVGCLVSFEENILGLEEALTNYFLDEDCTILFAPEYTLALWKEESRYYYFDPNECDESGKLVQGRGGVACVLWFTRLEDLVAKILGNVPAALHKGRFTLGIVSIYDPEEKAEDWFNFKALGLKKWILRGTFGQNDRRFSEESRNVQCTAIAVLAVAYKELQEEKEWSSDTIDQVLIVGDQFYNSCVEYLRQKDLFKGRHLMVAEVKRTFELENKRINLEIDDCLINGILNAPGDSNVPDLKKGFREFFDESEAGVVTANDHSMAVWKKDDAYYYYDSHSRNKEGIACGYGTACLLRLLTIDELSNMLLTNLGANPQNLYNISRITVKALDLTEDGSVRPPLNNYATVNDNIAILRSHWNQNDPKFEINSGKQAVPNSLAALATNLLLPSGDWKQQDLDWILRLGDDLYVQSMEANLGDEVPNELNVDEVTTNNVKKEVKIGANRVQAEIEEFSSGNLGENLKEAFETLRLKLEEEEEDCFAAIFESQYLTGAMWKGENSFYFFDPEPRDEHGQVYGRDDWSVVSEEFAGAGEETEDEETTDYEYESEDEPEGLSIEDYLDYDAIGEEEEEGGGAPWAIQKKGSAFWNQQEKENGRACVLRFNRLEDLEKHLLDNSPPKDRLVLEYSWKMVKVNNTPVLHEKEDPEAEEKDEMIGDWNNFKEIDRGRWILRSRRTMSDQMFLECNRGKQSVPMCIVALGVASYYSPGKYTQEVADAAMTYGDRLYTVVRRLRAKELKKNKLTDEEIEEVLKSVDFDLIHYPNKFCIWRTLATFTLELGVASGDYTSTLEEVPNVPSSLTKFFQEQSYGILQSNSYSVSIWQNHGFFYTFDPHKCGPSGVVSPLGVACITRFSTIDGLAEIFIQNLPKIGDHFFVLHSFSFVHDRCPIGWPPKEETERLPRVGGFASLMLGKQILRGGVKHTCANFSQGVNIYSSSVAVVALALSIGKNPMTWTKLMIDEIMNVGEDLFFASVEKLGDKFDTWGDTLKLDQVNLDFRIGGLKANWVMRCKEQKGIVDVKNSKTLNLRQGLDRFFEENSRGILLVSRLILAVWMQEDYGVEYIYMFDPNSRSATGLPTHGGYACLMRFKTAKIAADHLTACLLDEDKKKLRYLIVPVEVVIATVPKEKKKLCEVVEKKAEGPSTKPVLCPTRMTVLQQKRVVRQAAAERRCARERRRLASLGRTGLHKLNNFEWVIRALRSLRENRDVPVNFAAFFFLQAGRDLDEWDWSDLQEILEVGNLLYIDSMLAYKPADPKIGLDTTLRKFNCFNMEIKLRLRVPLICNTFNRANVLYVLNCAFMIVPCFMFAYDVYLVTVYFKSGYYWLFDPYGRDLEGHKVEDGREGSAVLMKFGRLDYLVDRMVYNFTGIPDQEVAKFALVFVEFEYVKDVEEMKKTEIGESLVK